MKVCLNGKLIEEEKAAISLFDPGFLYGLGVFETMRAYSGKVFRLDAHIERLSRGLGLLNMELNDGATALKEAVKRCVKENNLKEAYVRITVWQGKDRVNTAVMALPYDFPSKEVYGRGFKAMVSPHYRQNEFSPLSGVKSANYLNLLLAYQEARKKHYDEALLLNTQGFLAEASRANIFLVKDNCLMSPSLDCGCLAGITRDTVLALARKEKIRVLETRLCPEDLERADEAFLTNSLIELMPLVAVDGRAVNKGLPGKISQRLRKRYWDLIND